MVFSFFFVPLQLKPIVADPFVATSIGPRSEDSSDSAMEEDQEPLSPSVSASAAIPLLPRQRSTDSSSGVPRSTAPMPASKVGLGKVKGANRKGLQRSDDDTETILQQLAEQQRRNSRIQGNIETMLSREQLSTTSAWGVWMGSLANEIDPRLHRQMYRETMHMMMNFVESSRQLPPLHAPFPADQQPPQKPMQQPERPPPQQQPPTSQDQQPTMSYVDMIPPPPTQPLRNNRGQQSDTGTWDSNPFLGCNDTQMPMSGQRTASASFPSIMPPRPSSTPNISQSSIPNISGLSDMLNTPNVEDQSPSQPLGGPGTSGGGFF